MQEDVPLGARDPTVAHPPVLLPRGRPAPVTLAAVLLGVEAGLGLIAAVALLLAAARMPDAFRERAAVTVTAAGVTAADIDRIAGAIRLMLALAATVTLLLTIVGAALVRPLARGSPAARPVTFILAAVAFCGALGGMSFTAFGQRIDWAGGVSHPGEGVSAQVGQAYGEAMPGWLVGATGGLTDLRSLGYIAVAVFLALPVAQSYFRRRTPEAATVAALTESDTQARRPPDPDWSERPPDRS